MTKTYMPTFDKAVYDGYNKIAYGSFKEDDWFNSMVKNQENAENWYKNTYGEKEGKKEFNNLHNRLVTTPFDKIKEEEKQFTNYKASDFKVPEIKPVKYSYSGNGNKGELNREKTGCYKKGDENLPFLTNGNMRYIGTSSGTIDYQHYTDYIKIPITSEQGASMIGKGIGYFTNPGWYFIWDTPFSNQCDNVVGDILSSGNIYYDSKWRPKKSFYDYSTENGYEIISIME